MSLMMIALGETMPLHVRKHVLGRLCTCPYTSAHMSVHVYANVSTRLYAHMTFHVCTHVLPSRHARLYTCPYTCIRIPYPSMHMFFTHVLTRLDTRPYASTHVSLHGNKLLSAVTYIGHNYICHNYIGHNYIGPYYAGHNYAGHNCILFEVPRTSLGHNYIGHNYTGP